MSIDFNKLKEPFSAEDIEWRVQQSGIKDNKGWALVLAYVANRAVQARLDEVCGPENWRNEYEKAPDGGVMCGLSIRVLDEWVTKWDGAENTDIEAVKGGLSNSMKRAAVQWGIGRYLYKLDTTFVQVKRNGDNYIAIKENKADARPSLVGYWDAPILDPEFLPKGAKQQKKKDVAVETINDDDGIDQEATLLADRKSDLFKKLETSGYDNKVKMKVFIHRVLDKDTIDTLDDADAVDDALENEK